MVKESVWIQGILTDQAGPLQRFLPLVPYGVFSQWLSENLPSGSLIIDPFGSTPIPALEATQAGYRVLVAANNPVARFLLDITANPPSEIELKAALAELSSAVKGNERLPQHLSNLYLTECAGCGKSIAADAFLWEKGANKPYARIYTCDSCNDVGERPATESDADRAQAYQKHSLTWSRALERVAPLNDPDREHAEEALEAYLPRAVYALMTLVNTIDKLAPSPAATAERSAWIYRQRSLIALLLTACDRGNTLWSPGGARSRPRQLSRPGKYIEFNLWKVLEEAVTQWSSPTEIKANISVVTWPELPPTEGGISIFEGRIRDLVEEIGSQNIQGMISAVPRPNQAYWSLSALWAGWLWGRESSAPFKSVLRRRRYDWAWHTTALCSALQSIEPCLPKDTPFFTLVSEVESGYLTALFTAAKLSGFDLEGLALRSELSLLQAHWLVAKAGKQSSPDVSGPPALPPSQQIQEIIINNGLEYLKRRAEPSGVLGMQASSLIEILDTLLPVAADPNQAADYHTVIQNGLQQAYLNRGELQRFGGSEGSLEGGKWWGTTSNISGQPLADRVEISVVKALLRQPNWEFTRLDHHICQNFSGLDTPDVSLVRACLESYATEDRPGKWVLRAGEKIPERRRDLGEIRLLLDQIMQGVGLTTRSPAADLPESQFGLIYETNTGLPVYQFQVMVSAVLGPLMNIQVNASRGAYIICPGSRANLIDYKIRNNPLLNNHLQRSWQFIKFRLVRRISETMPADFDTLEKHLKLDPLMNRDPQIQLF